jgi:hypothetical protein
VPLRAGSKRVGALELSRLALPLPSLLPSVNQIGFDSYDLIAGTLARGKPRPDGVGRILMWVVEARHRGGGGPPGVAPHGNFAFPLAGTYRRNLIELDASQVNLQFSFGAVPLRGLDFRGQLAADGGFRPGASLYGQVTCADVPNYSAQLRIAGVCNADDTLAAYGTFLGHTYGRGGDANRRPKGVSAGPVTVRAPTAAADGEAIAQISLRRGVRYPAAKHLVSILLVDAETGAPVALDYRSLGSVESDGRGDIAAAHLRIPAGTALPGRLRAYVIADVFPLSLSEVSGDGAG